MKTSKNLALFVSLCAVVALYSCKGGSDPSKMFVKKWQIESFKSKAYDDQMAMQQKMADTTKDSAMKAKMTESLKMAQAGMEEMKKTTLTCNADGTCEISMTMMGQPKTSKNKWALVDDGKKVVMTDETNKSDTLTIEELTAEKMTISSSDQRGGRVYTTFKSIQ